MEPKEVHCRPPGGLWFVAVFFGLMGAVGLSLCLWGGKPAYPALGAVGSSLVLGGPFALISLSAILYVTRTQIIADETGLRWRTVGRWHTAAWADVTDYFVEEWLTSSGTATHQTKTPVRQSWVQIRGDLPNLTLTGFKPEDRMREFIAVHATGVTAPGWRTVGQFQRNLPLTGHYNTAVNRNTLLWLDRLHGIGIGAVMLFFGASWLTTHTLPGWGWLLTPTGLFFVGKQTLPLLVRPTYRETKRRLGWKVTVTRDGLVFANLSGETRIAWDDITDFYAEGLRFVVVTPTGEHDFLATLTHSEQFKTLIPSLAMGGSLAAWRTGTVRRRQVWLASGEEALQNCYHYRTQENCGVLWGMTLALGFAGLVAAGPALLALAGGRVPSTRELALTGLCALFVAALVWLWGQYWTGGIGTDADGLTQFGGPKPKRLPWSEVQGCAVRGSTDMSWQCVQGRYGRLHFWAGIGDAERLSEEIAAHLPVVQAVT